MRLVPNHYAPPGILSAGANGRILLRTEIEEFFGLEAKKSRADYEVLEGIIKVRFHAKGMWKVSTSGQKRGDGRLTCLLQIPRVLPKGKHRYTMRGEVLTIHLGEHD
jgi:hypothetical protein